MNTRRLVVIVLIVAFLFVAIYFGVTRVNIGFGESPTSQGFDHHPFPADFRVFSNQSAFNMVIPESASYEPHSTDYMAYFADNQAGDTIFVNVDAWTYPIYFADRNTPRYTVRLTASWRIASELKDVPIPDHAHADPEGDGHLVIIDQEQGMEYDLWMTKKTLTGWSAAWGNSIALDGDGVYTYGFSARGSGFAASSGVILPSEIEAGIIPHALYLAIDDSRVRGGGPIRPATESDGTSDQSWALPEGARLQLDPSLDISALGLSEQDMIIATAMQDYGIILGDNGGGFSLFAANPVGQNWDWGDYFPRDPSYNIISTLFDDKISITDLRVLTMGCQFDGPISPGQNLPQYHIYLDNETQVNDCTVEALGVATEQYDTVILPVSVTTISVPLLLLSLIVRRHSSIHHKLTRQ